jgi:hypothetical protein
MKSFKYEWTKDIYLLHAQIDCGELADNSIAITRTFVDGSSKNEESRLPESSHRFILSRTHPSEISVTVKYPVDSKLFIYEIVDRAYYPVTSFFEG